MILLLTRFLCSRQKLVFLSFPGTHEVDCYGLGELNSVNIFSALGIVTIGEEKKVCTTSESFIKMCDSNEVSKCDDILSNP